MTAIVLTNVSKHWEAQTAVQDLTVEMASGQFTVLLGPSGCGKSTTLRMIAGLEQPSAGRITIGGRDVAGVEPAKRGLSMVFQSYALFPHLTVAENIAFGLSVRRVPKEERRQRLARAADIVGLADLLDRRPNQLSGGQRQRVALARAVANEAPICLMDEPLSNLDAKLRHEMRSELRDLQQRLGLTVVYVTHDQTEAMSMADRIILMNAGRAEQVGPPEAIYARPATTFCARFIGAPAMNLLTLAPGASGAIAGEASGRAVVRDAGPGATIGLRPEDIRLSDDSGIPGLITGIDYHGADTIVSVALGDQRVLVRTSGRFQGPQDQRVWLLWDPERIHLFDETGNRQDDRWVALPVAA